MADRPPNRNVMHADPREEAAALLGRILARHWLRQRALGGRPHPGTPPPPESKNRHESRNMES
jgi:hypothetical protein